MNSEKLFPRENCSCEGGTRTSLGLHPLRLGGWQGGLVFNCHCLRIDRFPAGYAFQTGQNSPVVLFTALNVTA
jgi:hypothetical protein